MAAPRLASRELVTLPLPAGAPAWFQAYHQQLLQTLQRSQQFIDQGQGLRGRPSISAPLTAYGNYLEDIGEAPYVKDAAQQSGDHFSVSRTFSVHATGCTTDVTDTAVYSLVGKQVLLALPLLSGTSNAATFQLTGVPAPIHPPRLSWHVVRVTNNGTDAVGLVKLNAGSDTLDVYATIAAGAFNNAGTKTLFPCVLSYVLL